MKNSLKIVSGKGWRRFCYDLHVAGGMYTLVLLLVMALTGLSWSFSWYRTGFYKVFGVETTQGGGGHGASAQTAAQGGERAQGRSGGRPGGEHRERNSFSPFTSWQKVYEELKELNPDYKQITVFKGSATVSFNRLGPTAIRSIPVAVKSPGLPYIRMPTLQEKSVAGYSPFM